ncbi:GAF domain-containing protein [Kangiella sp.]|uniref:GAF domain-containing protein n=1 Tax=Kangiella sp. TaxID=1920245 RepID=UPI003A92EEB9
MFQLDESQIQEYQNDKPEYYRQLALQLDALLAEDSNWITNMAQMSAFIFQMLPDLNWSGFYLVNPEKSESLILGPYQGKVACVHIPFGRGVCGAAAATLETQLVEDVHQFEGHIACDAASQSEVVIPVVVDGDLKGVLDIDSPNTNRFDQQDADGLTLLLNTFIKQTQF